MRAVGPELDISNCGAVMGLWLWLVSVTGHCAWGVVGVDIFDLAVGGCGGLVGGGFPWMPSVVLVAIELGG